MCGVEVFSEGVRVKCEVNVVPKRVRIMYNVRSMFFLPKKSKTCGSMLYLKLQRLKCRLMLSL